MATAPKNGKNPAGMAIRINDRVTSMVESVKQKAKNPVAAPAAVERKEINAMTFLRFPSRENNTLPVMLLAATSKVRPIMIIEAYPADKLQVVNDTIIGVESMLDTIMMRKWGHFNTLALMGMEMSDEQADFIASRCKKFIDLFDNDEGGRKARDKARVKLKKRGVMYFTCTYPDYGKDPIDWGEIETNQILSTARIVTGIPRL